MKSITAIGTFPTPYGVGVPVYQPKDIDPNDPEAVAFDMEGTAICAGIYDPAERKRFADVSCELGHMPNLEDFGGHVVPKTALLRPNLPAYPTIPNDPGFPTEAWITGAMDRHRWCDRADFLIDIIDQNMRQVTDDIGATIYPLGISILLTGALEHLGEEEIDCIEAAALYAVSSHEAWRKAGIGWLRPFRETWFQEWRRARPAYTNYARALSAGTYDLPAWLSDVGGGQ